MVDGHTHATAIDCLHGLGVIRGRLVDTFEPDASLRRDQMATIVAGAVEAAGGRLPAPRRGAFADVSGGPHRDAIERLAAAGIVEGRGSGRYDPGARVPRGQMTAFLVRAHDHVLGASPAPHPMPSATTTVTRTRRPSTEPRSSASRRVVPRPRSGRRSSPPGRRPRRSSPACSAGPAMAAASHHLGGGPPRR